MYFFYSKKFKANFGNTIHYKLGQLSINENDDPMIISNWTKKYTAVFEGTIDVYTGRRIFTTSPAVQKIGYLQQPQYDSLRKVVTKQYIYYVTACTYK